MAIKILFSLETLRKNNRSLLYAQTLSSLWMFIKVWFILMLNTRSYTFISLVSTATFLACAHHLQSWFTMKMKKTNGKSIDPTILSNFYIGCLVRRSFILKFCSKIGFPCMNAGHLVDSDTWSTRTVGRPDRGL